MVLSGARGVARVVFHGNRPLTQARYTSSRFLASIPLSDSPPRFEWPHAAGCFRSHGASSRHNATLPLAMILDLTCVAVVVPILLSFCLKRPLRRPTPRFHSESPRHGNSQHARPTASELKVAVRTSGMGHDEPHCKARRPGGLASRRIARSRVLGPVS